MKKFRVFPEGFDPRIACGPPTIDDIEMGIIWNEEDTKHQQELEAKAVIVEAEDYLTGRWSQEIK